MNALFDRLSKKLGVTGGYAAVVAELVKLGLSPEKAALYLTIVTGIYLVAQGAVDYIKEKHSGKGPLAALEAAAKDLKEQVGSPSV